MEVHYGFDSFPADVRSVVSVGSFDGVHRGHRLLIERLTEEAARQKAQSVVVTFDPHPRQVLRGENRLLTTLPEKLCLLGQTAVDHVVVVHFTRAFSQLTSDEFLNRYLIDKLHAVAVLSGDEHHFGHNREGNPALLAERQIKSLQVDRYENISSTAVRAAVEAGDMEEAARLLGAPYLILTGEPDPTKLLPPEGRYRVRIDDDPDETDIEIGPELFFGTPQTLWVLGKSEPND